MNMKEVSTGKFYMLRCVIAMAHADGIVTDAELAYISGITNRLHLTDEQQKILDNDLENAQSVESLLPYINDPRYRGQVVDFARIMAYKDGHLHPSEDMLLKKLHANAMDGVDMPSLRKAVQENVQREMVLHDIQIQKNRPIKGKHFVPWFQVFDELLLRLGIDILSE